MVPVGIVWTLSFAASAGNILVLGDSISAGYGIPREQGWVNLLQKQLQQQGHDETVINASISGETTEGGRNRLPALLEKHHPEIVIVELGGNDGLRGFQIDRLRANLDDIVQRSQRSNAKVLLVGMKMPPNYGLRYTSDFYASFTAAAEKFDVPLVPFLFDGIITNPDMMQDDGIHPTAAAQRRLLDNIWPHLKTLL
jgi:acyl-CoA thioesterase-1